MLIFQTVAREGLGEYVSSFRCVMMHLEGAQFVRTLTRAPREHGALLQSLARTNIPGPNRASVAAFVRIGCLHNFPFMPLKLHSDSSEDSGMS